MSKTRKKEETKGPEYVTVKTFSQKHIGKAFYIRGDYGSGHSLPVWTRVIVNSIGSNGLSANARVCPASEQDKVTPRTRTSVPYGSTRNVFNMELYEAALSIESLEQERKELEEKIAEVNSKITFIKENNLKTFSEANWKAAELVKRVKSSKSDTLIADIAKMLEGDE